MEVALQIVVTKVSQDRGRLLSRMRAWSSSSIVMPWEESYAIMVSYAQRCAVTESDSFIRR